MFFIFIQITRKFFTSIDLHSIININLKDVFFVTGFILAPYEVSVEDKFIVSPFEAINS